MDIKHLRVATNGIHLHVATAGEGPLVLLVHGWPESWLSWRHQLQALAAAGYCAAAVDVRGYGESDKPSCVADYRMRKTCADLAGVIEHLSPGQPAAVFGHDWGAPIAWHTAMLHPDKTRAVGGLSVPHFPRGDILPMQRWHDIYTAKGRFFYQVYFQKEGVAEAEFEADMAQALRLTYHGASAAGMQNNFARAARGESLEQGLDATFLDPAQDPGKAPQWMGEEILAQFVASFEKGGMRGPLNRYRCQDMDWEELTELAGAKITQPAFFVAGDLDPVMFFLPDLNSEAIIAMMRQNVPDLRSCHVLKDCGHWTQQEKPEEVNKLMLEFLAEL